MRPWVLDLCCGAGGFSAGLHAAGFNVMGVDIVDQPDYPFPFLRADALTVPLDGFAAIIGSPPCQRWSIATPPDRRGAHPDILTPLRERLSAVSVPWILENVPGAPMRQPVQLCGITLRLGVQRHRLFESNVALQGTPCHHDSPGRPAPVYGTYGGTGGLSVADARRAMGTPWMPWPALVQSIPPAYGMFLGAQMWAHVDMSTSEVPALLGDACHQVAPLMSGIPEKSIFVTNARRPGIVTAKDDLGWPDTVTDDLERDGSAQVVPQLGGYVPDRGSSVTVSPACKHCGTAAVSRPATGRWGRYCSHACRQAAYRLREAAQGRKR